MLSLVCSVSMNVLVRYYIVVKLASPVSSLRNGGRDDVFGDE